MSDIAHTLDARGLFCPEPVMLLHKVMDDANVGDVIEVLATDPTTVKDFIRFCAFLSHELMVHDDKDGELRFLIRKGEEEEE